MTNEKSLSNLHRQYLEPVGEVSIEGWNGIEIYPDEDYWEINGDYVPDAIDVMEEYIKANNVIENYFKDNGTLRRAGE